jgi:hypothetical protein
MSYILIQKVTVTSGSSPTIALTTLPSTFVDLKLFITAKSTDTTINRSLIYLTLNGNTTNTDYISYNWYTEDGSNNAEYTTSTTKTRMTSLVSASKSGISSYAFGTSAVWINNYNDSSNYQSIYSTVTQRALSTNYDNWGSGVTWKQNAAITDITLNMDVGNFAAGSTVHLYGLK